ncbi:MAG: hypothetical protein OEW12_08885 [Deltaproteobacteria bacterium]|nr:hypothetical protein [Deltaproteobacteria bacterium]
MRIVFQTATTLLGLLLLAGIVQAQVAVPSIITATDDFVTNNPAAIQWGTPSRVGLSSINMAGQEDDKVTGIKVPSSNFSVSGYNLGARIVKEHFAFAVQTSQLKVGVKAAPAYSQNISAPALALSVDIGGMAAIGVGQGQLIKATKDTGKDESETTTTPMVGVSFKLANVIYLGAATGNDTLAFRDKLAPANDVDAKRPFNTYGLGLRGGDKDFMYHIEYDADFRKDYSISKPANSKADLKEVTRTGVAEIVVKNIALGLEGSEKRTDNQPDNYTLSRTAAYRVGWSPMEGFALTYAKSVEKENDITRGVYTILNTDTLSLAYAF